MKNSVISIGLTAMISALTLLINPLYVIFLATYAQIVVKKNYLFPFLVSALIVSFSFLLSTRITGAVWGAGGADDGAYYIERFILAPNESFLDLAYQFFIIPKDNEPVLYFFAKAISLFSSSSYIFIFSFYVLTFILLFLAAHITSKKHSFLVIFLFFFGIGGFLDQPLLHLWRSNLASLLLYIGIIGYKENSRLYKLFLPLSFFTHLAAIPFGLCFLLIHHFKFLRTTINSILLGLTVVAVLFVSLEYLLDSAIARYFYDEGSLPTSSVALGIFLFFAVRIPFKDEIIYFLIVISTALILGIYFLPSYAVLLSRSYLFITPIFTYALFRILISYPKLIIFLLPLLFVRKISSLVDNPSTAALMPNLFEFFNGILFTVL